MVRGNTVGEQGNETGKRRLPIKSVVSSQLSPWAIGINYSALPAYHMGGQCRLKGPEKAKKYRLWHMEVRLECTEVVRTRGHRPNPDGVCYNSPGLI